MQSDRTNRFPFIVRNAPKSAPDTACRMPPFPGGIRRAIRTPAKARPVNWATTVPQAMPEKPIQRLRRTLATMFTTLTTRSVAMELTVSCIPINQPLMDIRERVAGAAQMRIKK